jgi:hypothetical protein
LYVLPYAQLLPTFDKKPSNFGFRNTLATLLSSLTGKTKTVQKNKTKINFQVSIEKHVLTMIITLIEHY